jgi:O-acetyl-ADP-ribose deacetylase (regulator of RNase III)
MQIEYVIGDATRPVGDGNKIIVHVANRAGAWGSGFVMALSRRWPEPERRYRAWARGYAVNDGAYIPLGAVQYVPVDAGLVVANMIGQYGPAEGHSPPICYDSLRECLQQVAARALRTGALVHGPMFGAGLAGGDWRLIEQMIIEELIAKGVHVTIYELPARPANAGTAASADKGGQTTFEW